MCVCAWLVVIVTAITKIDCTNRFCVFAISIMGTELCAPSPAPAQSHMDSTNYCDECDSLAQTNATTTTTDQSEKKHRIHTNTCRFPKSLRTWFSRGSVTSYQIQAQHTHKHLIYRNKRQQWLCKAHFGKNRFSFDNDIRHSSAFFCHVVQLSTRLFASTTFLLSLPLSFSRFLFVSCLTKIVQTKHIH